MLSHRFLILKLAASIAFSVFIYTQLPVEGIRAKGDGVSDAIKGNTVTVEFAVDQTSE